MKAIEAGENYYSEEFDEKWIINNVYPKTVDITYIGRPGSVYQKSNRLRRENKEQVHSLLKHFFKLI